MKEKEGLPRVALQFVAVCCIVCSHIVWGNVCVVMRCSVFSHTAFQCSTVLHCLFMYCVWRCVVISHTVLQSVAVCCRVFSCMVRCGVLHWVCGDVLHCLFTHGVAVCGGVLQCVAVYCSVLQCVAVGVGASDTSTRSEIYELTSRISRIHPVCVCV